MPSQPVRIAMWSGPRNISTAMLRSWENRTDTFVCDEPLYAHYLRHTGIEHPGRDAVLASQPNDWEPVAEWLTGAIPGGEAVFYQKHMAHHLLPRIGREWLDRLTHAFLIRDPREMLPSLVKGLPHAGLFDTGLAQQVELFEWTRERTGRVPPVLDARDVLEDPRGMLTALCDAVGVPFEERMLSWPAGKRDTDGVWAPHWYASVEKSTGFEPHRPKTDPLPDFLRPLYEECLPLYQTLRSARLLRSG